MGYQTDWIGYLHVQPALNETEIEIINRISGSIFFDPGEGGLHVADARDDVVRELMADSPRGHSNWTACPQGCCLSYDGGDKANYMHLWIRWLMETFIAPGARAAGMAGLEQFTCDHVLNGMVVGSRRDNRQLVSITARENELEVELLWPGVPEWSDYPPLAYHDRIDEFREWVMKDRLKEARDKVLARRAEYESRPSW